MKISRWSGTANSTRYNTKSKELPVLKSIIHRSVSEILVNVSKSVEPKSIILSGPILTKKHAPLEARVPQTTTTTSKDISIFLAISPGEKNVSNLSQHKERVKTYYGIYFISKNKQNYPTVLNAPIWQNIFATFFLNWEIFCLEFRLTSFPFHSNLFHLHIFFYPLQRRSG